MNQRIRDRVTDSANLHKFLAGILVLAFVVRVGAMVLLHTWVFPTERAFGYETGEIGYALANGQGFSWPQTWRAVGPPGGGQFVQRDHPVPTSWEAPIYPIIVGLTFRVFGSYTALSAIILELFQVLLSMLICGVLFRLGQLLFNDWAGLLAALIFAVYPASVHFSVQKVEYSPLLTLLGLLIILQIIELSKRPSIGGSVALGILFGVGTLVNPVILAFYPFGMLWLLVRFQSSWSSRLKYAVLIIGCCAATMTPWLIRNYLVFDHFVFLRPNFTRELVISNFPVEAYHMELENPKAVAGNDSQMSTAFNQKAWSLIVQKPAQVLRTASTRFMQYWTYLGESAGRGQFVAGAGYYPVLLFAVAGVWFAHRQRQAQLLILFLLTMPLPFYVTWAVKGRFRFPLEPILILFASYGVTVLVGISTKTPSSAKES